MDLSATQREIQTFPATGATAQASDTITSTTSFKLGFLMAIASKLTPDLIGVDSGSTEELSRGIVYYVGAHGGAPRFNLWWTFVYPDKRGFNSKCPPEDVYVWCT